MGSVVSVGLFPQKAIFYYSVLSSRLQGMEIPDAVVLFLQIYPHVINNLKVCPVLPRDIL